MTVAVFLSSFPRCVTHACLGTPLLPAKLRFALAVASTGHPTNPTFLQNFYAPQTQHSPAPRPFCHDLLMKPLPERGLCAAILLTTGFLAAPLAADPPPPPSPASAPTDPFVKKDAPPVDETGPVSNVILTFESYTLSQADGAALLQENDTDQARHDRVLELVKAGKAHFDAVLSCATKSGQQSVVEQVDVLPYAIGFKFGPGKLVSATDYKKRNVGRRLVFKGQETTDHSRYDIVLFSENTSLKGFYNENVDNGTGEYYANQPLFSSGRVNTLPPYLPYDQIRFIGTYSPMPKDSMPQKVPASGSKAEDSEMTLVFGKATRMQLDPGTLKDVKPLQCELMVSFYSMDRDQAFRILDQKQTMDSAYQAVQSLVKTNQAKLEHTTVLRTSVGTKCNADEVTEFTYSTGAMNQFVTQDVGFSAEIKASFDGPPPFLNIDITKYQMLNFAGHVNMEGAAPYNESQPIFALQSIVTNINSALGEHELLGTFTPPGDTGVNGQKDDGRVWLAFLQTTAINP
jgi:hypothetical protein